MITAAAIVVSLTACGSSEVQSASAFHAKIGVERIAPTKQDPWLLSVGSYDFVSTNQPPGGRNFYDAHSDSLGVGGDFDFQTVLNATEIRGVVDCITVSGKQAAMHGTVTFSNPPSAYPNGASVVWRVVGPTTSGGAASSVPQGGAGICCSGGFNACNPPLFNIKNGLLIVRSG